MKNLYSDMPQHTPAINRLIALIHKETSIKISANLGRWQTDAVFKIRIVMPENGHEL